jgi:Acyclic terpene utilisation family protein AtuA
VPFVRAALGAFQLVKQAPKLDYLVADYLAEVTMGILARVKQKSEQKGVPV